MSSQSIKELLSQYTKVNHRPDNSSYKAITLSDAQKIAGVTDLSLFDVEKSALINGIVPQRYSRNQRFLSTKEQLKLHLSKVAVVGLGGLGGTATEILARVGIGNLILIDGDVFDESNLNRQLLSSPGALGKAKAKIAKQRVQEINPATQVKEVEDYLTTDNGDGLLLDADLALDCLDTIRDRFVLQEACRQKSIPFISAAIGGTSGQITVVLPGEARLEQIYGSKDKAPAKGIEASLGTPAFTAMYMAAIQCSEVVKLIVNGTSHLSDGLLLTDIADHVHETVSFK